MKKTFFLFLMIFFCAALRADLLDDVSRQLDLLEKEYWRSQYSATGEYRRSVEKRLGTLVSTVNRISIQLRRVRLNRIADLGSPAGSLAANYGKVRTATIKRFTLNFSGTAMRDYTREFRSYLRLKEEQQAAENEEKDSKGRKKRRPRSNARRAVPTLANVDMIEYERWIAERIAENMDKFLSRRNNGSRSERDKMNDMVNVYFTAIKELRIGLVKIRQKTKITFK